MPIVLFLLIPIYGCGNTEKGIQLSDGFYSNEKLQTGCENGIRYNTIYGSGYGFLENSFRGAVALGNLSGQDFNKIQKWFLQNCPSGW